ncbi:MAG TPA: hypothetical protein VGC19_00220 [Rhodanobacter sp.]
MLEGRRFVARSCVIVACAALSVWAMSASARSSASPYTCHEAACGIPHDGAYDQLVMGKVAGIGSPDDAQGLFKRMRIAKHWQALPASPYKFSQNLIPIVIDSGRGMMTVLMARWEFAAAPLRQGDFVRYSPHNGGVEPPPKDSVAHKYWDIDGCVLVLCRAGDLRCAGRYSPGIYRKRDGVAITAISQKPLAGAPPFGRVTTVRKESAH